MAEDFLVPKSSPVTSEKKVSYGPRMPLSLRRENQLVSKSDNKHMVELRNELGASNLLEHDNNINNSASIMIKTFDKSSPE